MPIALIIRNCQIRIATEEEIKKAEEDTEEQIDLLEGQAGPPQQIKTNGKGKLTAFGFLKIAKHFFRDYEFEDYKVDGFTEEVVSLDSEITKTQFNTYMKQSIAIVKSYKQFFDEKPDSSETLNPFTMIRHCLYLSDKQKFSSMLTNVSKNSFDEWLQSNQK